MGLYHGFEGFETFSHKKGVFIQSRFNAVRLFSPPRDKRVNAVLNVLIGKPTQAQRNRRTH
jgi:hypothetical protein